MRDHTSGYRVSRKESQGMRASWRRTLCVGHDTHHKTWLRSRSGSRPTRATSLHASNKPTSAMLAAAFSVVGNGRRLPGWWSGAHPRVRGRRLARFLREIEADRKSRGRVFILPRPDLGSATMGHFYSPRLRRIRGLTAPPHLTLKTVTSGP